MTLDFLRDRTGWMWFVKPIKIHGFLYCGIYNFSAHAFISENQNCFFVRVKFDIAF